MQSHVLIQSREVVEAFVAHVTSVSLLFGVGFGVVGEVLGALEPQGARGAGEGPGGDCQHSHIQFEKKNPRQSD